MTTAELIRGLRESFGPAILSVAEPVAGKVQVAVAPESVVRVAKALTQDHNARFLITAGIDSREDRGCFDVDHIFSLDKAQIFIILRTPVWDLNHSSVCHVNVSHSPPQH